MQCWIVSYVHLHPYPFLLIDTSTNTANQLGLMTTYIFRLSLSQPGAFLIHVLSPVCYKGNTMGVGQELCSGSDELTPGF